MRSVLLSLFSVTLLGIAGCRTYPSMCQSLKSDVEGFSDLPIEVFPKWHLPEWKLHNYCLGLCTREEWR